MTKRHAERRIWRHAFSHVFGQKTPCKLQLICGSSVVNRFLLTHSCETPKKHTRDELWYDYQETFVGISFSLCRKIIVVFWNFKNYCHDYLRKPRSYSWRNFLQICWRSSLRNSWRNSLKKSHKQLLEILKQFRKECWKVFLKNLGLNCWNDIGKNLYKNHGRNLGLYQEEILEKI